MVLLTMYLGRFFSLLSLDEIFIQSLFGKNIRKHQPFDYSTDGTLSAVDPRLVKDQLIQNVLAHWIPKFIIDSMYDLVTNITGEIVLHDSKVHTLTYKDPSAIIAPTLANHLETFYCMKPRPTDGHGQNNFGQYRHLVEQEIQNDEMRDFISISKQPLNKEYFDKLRKPFQTFLTSIANNNTRKNRTVKQVSRTKHGNEIRKKKQIKLFFSLL